MATKRPTHVERYEQQCAAEDKEEPHRWVSEAKKLQSAKASKDEVTELAHQLLARKRQRALRQNRWRRVAEARDALDHFVAKLRREVQPLKRPHSKLIEKWRSQLRAGKIKPIEVRTNEGPVELPPWSRFPEEDFADIDAALARSLKVVVDALLRYEALAKPGHTDPYPLNELHTVLFILGA